MEQMRLFYFFFCPLLQIFIKWVLNNAISMNAQKMPHMFFTCHSQFLPRGNATKKKMNRNILWVVDKHW